MKHSLLKKYFSLVLAFCITAVFAQNSLPLPQNTMFYMEINGNALNKKINWEKFNPILLEVTKDKDKKNSWNDYSKTGIKYDGTQYHYATVNDSVTSYTAHFTLDNNEKFESFVNSIKKEGLEATQKSNYSYVSLDKETFVAWDGKHAVLKMITYSKPYKWEDDIAVDSAVAVVDSAAVAIDSTYIAEAPVEAVPFDYKEEIQYLKEDIEYYKQNVQDYQAKIKKTESDIKYLEKNHKYPEEKPEDNSALPNKDEEQDYDDYQDDEYAQDYQKQLDSIDIENFKIKKFLVEKSFDEIFKSGFNIDVPKEKLRFRNPNADVFIYTDYGNLMKNGTYGSMSRIYGWQNYFTRLYDNESSFNLYFDKDKVRLVSNSGNKDPQVQKSISEMYKGKRTGKLSKLISDKSIGYYALNIDGYKSFDTMYELIRSMGENDKYQKEIDLAVESVKIILDEKAISKIAPGNALFVLNKMSTKKVDYTEYEYDDEYNETEVKKTKDVAVPDFTFAFLTENEGYWNRLFDMLASNKKTKEDFLKDGDFYLVKQEESSPFSNIFFTVKDGIVYITTSKENIFAGNQTADTRKWAKESEKYAISGKVNVQKIVVGLEAEFKDSNDREMFSFLRKNMGQLSFKAEAKQDNVQTEFSYDIKSDSENSLMYFFDLMEMLYKMDEASKITKTIL